MITEAEAISAAQQLLIDSRLWPSVLREITREEPPRCDPFLQWGTEECWVLAYERPEGLSRESAEMLAAGHHKIFVLVHGTTGSAAFFPQL